MWYFYFYLVLLLKKYRIWFCFFSYLILYCFGFSLHIFFVLVVYMFFFSSAFFNSSNQIVLFFFLLQLTNLFHIPFIIVSIVSIVFFGSFVLYIVLYIWLCCCILHYFWVLVVDSIIYVSVVASICVSVSVLFGSSIVTYCIWLQFENFIRFLSLFTCFYCKLSHQVVVLDILFLQA